jgi:hypothetical protein
VGADGNSESETGLMFAALRQGWAVIAPDYEGPRSDFLGAAGEAHSVLDGLRAALHFPAAGFTSRTPLGLWGYSGGSLATVLAAMSQPKYAPDLHFAAIALGGLVTDLKATLYGFNGGPGGGAIVVGLVGLNRSYPEYRLEQYLNASGRQAVANSQSDCLTDGIVKYPFADISQYEAYPNAIDRPAVTAMFENASPLWLPGIPTTPIYDYHVVGDEFAPIPGDRQLMHRFCNNGVPGSGPLTPPTSAPRTHAAKPGACHRSRKRRTRQPSRRRHSTPSIRSAHRHKRPQCRASG